MYVRIKGRIYKVYQENGEFYIIKRVSKKEIIEPGSVIQGEPPKKPKKIGINVAGLIDSDKKLRDTVEKLQKLSQKEKTLQDEFERAKQQLIACESRNGELIAMIMDIASSKGFKKETALEVLREIKIFIDDCASEMKKNTEQNLNIIQGLQSKVVECETKLSRRPENCDEHIKKSGELREMLTDYERELSTRPKNCDDHINRSRDLEAENKRLLKRITELEERPTNVTVADCSEIERSLAQARDLIKKLDCSKKIADAMERNTAELEKLSEINAKLKRQLSERPENCNEYIEKRFQSLSEENERLKQVDCTPLQKRIDVLLAHVNELEKKPTIVADCSSVEKQLKDARDLIERLELEQPSKDCSEEERRIEELSKALERNTSKLSEISEQNEKLQRELTQSGKRPENCDEFIAEVRKLKEVITMNRDENTARIKELTEEYKQKIKDESNTAETYQDAFEKLKLAYTELDGRCKEFDRSLPEKHNDLVEEFNSLSDSHKVLERKLGEREKDLREVLFLNERLKEEGEEVAKDNEKLFKDLREEKAKNARLEQEHRELTSKNDKLSVDLAQLRIEAQRLQDYALEIYSNLNIAQRHDAERYTDFVKRTRDGRIPADQKPFPMLPEFEYQKRSEPFPALSSLS